MKFILRTVQQRRVDDFQAFRLFPPVSIFQMHTSWKHFEIFEASIVLPFEFIVLRFREFFVNRFLKEAFAAKKQMLFNIEFKSLNLEA